VPFNQLPHALNPDQGYLVSWNNKPAPEWNNTVTSFLGMFGPVQRANTLINLLDTLTPGSATLETLAEINRIAGHTTDTPREEGVGADAPEPAPFRVLASTRPLLWTMLDRVRTSRVTLRR